MKDKSKPLLVSDLGNVIVFFDIGLALDRFLNKFNIPVAEIQSYFKKNNLADKIDTGELQPEEFHRLFSQRFGIRMDFTEFCSFWNEIFTLNTKYLDFLSVFSNDYHFVILSNTNRVHWEFIITRFPAIKDFFKDYILSFERGIKKPDNEIFSPVLELQPERKKIVFVDDTEENIVSAKKLGIHCIHYTDFQNFRTRFEKLHPLVQQ